jgi:LuxR family transcriptional regulator, maltose regulon positive regulatory protein
MRFLETMTRPRALDDAVRRQRLAGCLDKGVGRRLILVSAPAGYGKTALLADWVLSHPEHILANWVTLTCANDADAVVRLVADGLLRAIGDTADDGGDGVAGEGCDGLLALTAVVAATRRPCVTVLDDYQVVRQPEVDAMMTELLSALPENWTLVIGTREEPRLPLPRLRASLELTELHASDLRFSAEETGDLLARTAGRPVARDACRLLSERTEGWAAGLRLAALQLADTADARSFARGFDGRNTSVAAYFGAEVFEPLDADAREFLLRTAVLDEVSPSSADAVNAGGDSRGMLAEFARRNVFVEAVDATAESYRFHPMFRSFLLGELRARHPELEPELSGHAAEARSARPVSSRAQQRGVDDVTSRRMRGAGKILTDSEFVVLEKMDAEDSLREIGAKLFLSLNTVKSHARSIYRKLGVGSREEALRRERETGVLPPRPRGTAG